MKNNFSHTFSQFIAALGAKVTKTSAEQYIKDYSDIDFIVQNAQSKNGFANQINIFFNNLTHFMENLKNKKFCTLNSNEMMSIFGGETNGCNDTAATKAGSCSDTNYYHYDDAGKLQGKCTHFDCQE